MKSFCFKLQLGLYASTEVLTQIPYQSATAGLQEDITRNLMKYRYDSHCVCCYAKIKREKYVFQYVRTLTLHSYGWATETTPLHACHILPLLFWCQNAAKGHLWDSYRCAMIISFESKSSFPFLLFWPFAPLLMEQLMVRPHQYVLYCKNFVALVCHTMKNLVLICTDKR